MAHILNDRALTKGQAWILGAAAVPMFAVGIVGAWGTYTNIKTVFPRSATALGVVASGEGATFVLALVYVGLTLLGQSSPAAVRVGLWTLPAIASTVGAVVAPAPIEAVVYAVTPMAMCVSAEGMGLLARRIVVHRTGVDMEVQRRNARTIQKLAYHRARAANHPDEDARKESELQSWKLAKRVGTGDITLGTDLVTIQRERMTDGADAALAAMFAPAVIPALTASVTPALTGTSTRDGSGTPSATDGRDRHNDGTVAVTKPPLQRPGVTAGLEGVTGAGTQVSADSTSSAADTATGAVTQSVPETVTGDVAVTDTNPAPSHEQAQPVTLAEIAAVAGVPTPVAGERLTDGQLHVVLRHLRYSEDPPLSYRHAVSCFREAGFVGSEERVRRIWGALMSKEESTHKTSENEGEPEDTDV
ncbi:hypothetical protein ABZ442_30590 [Streptomyces triculaminicus]|uniref:hypothetical protein n=1 Tax=Streptomyces triculaminicus TaxID=2816232 RepID=UPI00340E633F